MTDKDKILANIESLLYKTNYEPFTDEVFGRIQTLKELKSYINSLQEEPVSEDLEEAVENYAPDFSNSIVSKAAVDAVRDAFKAGAKWQKKQMMEKTIVAHCFGFQGAALFTFRLPADNYLVGSKVKVIVIKQD